MRDVFFGMLAVPPPIILGNVPKIVNAINTKTIAITIQNIVFENIVFLGLRVSSTYLAKSLKIDDNSSVLVFMYFNVYFVMYFISNSPNVSLS